MTEPLPPLARLVQRVLFDGEGQTTTQLAEVVCAPHWAVQTAIEELHGRGLAKRSSEGWMAACSTGPCRCGHARTLHSTGPCGITGCGCNWWGPS